MSGHSISQLPPPNVNATDPTPLVSPAVSPHPPTPSHSLIPCAPSSRVHNMTEKGLSYRDSIVQFKLLQDKLAAAHVLHTSGQQSSSFTNGGHVFTDDFTNLICMESTFLSIRGDVP